MGLVVQTASSQYLSNATPPIKVYPFTVAMWAYPFTANTQVTMWSIRPSSGVADVFSIYKTSGGSWETAAIRSTAAVATVGGVTANAWQYILVRFISATNRRISVLRSDGSTGHAQSTTSKTPTSGNLVAEEIGAISTANFFDGIIAEYWKTNTDIQPDGAQLENELLSELAYDGPFSIPHIAKDLIDYRSLHEGLSSDEDEQGESYFGPLGLQTWTKVNAPILGAHPPLQSPYRKPGFRIVSPAMIMPVTSPVTFNASFARNSSPIGVGIY